MGRVERRRRGNIRIGREKEGRKVRRKALGKAEKGRQIREWTEKPGKRWWVSLPLE